MPENTVVMEEKDQGTLEMGVEEQPEPTEIPETGKTASDELDAFLEIAKGKGIDSDKILNMSEEEVAEMMKEELPVEPPQVEIPPVVEIVSPAPSPELNELTNLRGLYGRQTQEVGQLRAIVQQYKPFLDMLNDPAFAQHVMAFGQNAQTPVTQTPEPTYDPFDPSSVAQYVQTITEKGVHRVLTEREQKAREAETQRQQKEFINRYNTGIQTGIADLVGRGIPQGDVQNSINALISRVISGDVALPALILANYDAAIADAEARGKKLGEEEAKKKVVDLAHNPVRTAAVPGLQTSVKPVSSVTDLDSINTPEEMNAYMETLTLGSKEWHRAMRKAEQRKWT